MQQHNVASTADDLLDVHKLRHAARCLLLRLNAHRLDRTGHWTTGATVEGAVCAGRGTREQDTARLSEASHGADGR